jgi:hypothetical protein
MGSAFTGKLQLAGQLLDKLREIIEGKPVLKAPFREVHIIWGGLNYTLLPEALVKKENSAEYLRFANTIHAGDEAHPDNISCIRAVDIYSIPSILLEYYRQMWPSHRLHHYMACFADGHLARLKRSEGPVSVFLNISLQSFDLLIVEEGRLIYCNTFEYRTTAELIYYALYTFRQLKINMEKCRLRLSGEVEKDSEIAGNLRTYIPDTELISFGPAVRFSQEFQGSSLHKYYNLLTVLPCASSAENTGEGN